MNNFVKEKNSYCRLCRDGHALSCVGEKKGRKDSPKGGISISPLGDEIRILLKRRQRVKTAFSICRQVLRIL